MYDSILEMEWYKFFTILVNAAADVFLIIATHLLLDDGKLYRFFERM